MIDLVSSQPAVLLVVLALASFRITRLLVHDEVLGTYPVTRPEDGEPYPYVDEFGRGVEQEEADQDQSTIRPNRGTFLRRRLDLFLFDEDGDAKGPVRRWLGKLATCSYCMGVWVTQAVVAAWWHAGDWGPWVIVVAAVAGAQGYVSGRPGA